MKALIVLALAAVLYAFPTSPHENPSILLGSDNRICGDFRWVSARVDQTNRLIRCANIDLGNEWFEFNLTNPIFAKIKDGSLPKQDWVHGKLLCALSDSNGEDLGAMELIIRRDSVHITFMINYFGGERSAAVINSWKGTALLNLFHPTESPKVVTGVGKQLIRFASWLSCRCSVGKIVLNSLLDSCGFYEKLGFEQDNPMGFRFSNRYCLNTGGPKNKLLLGEQDFYPVFHDREPRPML